MTTAIGKIASYKIGPWKGMNEKVSPDTLPPGVAADLQNVLLDESPGIIVKRQGSRAQAALPSGLPPRDTYVFTKLDGTAYQLVSDGVTLYYTTDPSIASLYTMLVTSLNPDGFMQFETAENKVWLSNGIGAVMSWDGTTLITFDRTFTSITNLTTVSTTSFIHSGLGAVNDYWNGMKLVFTVGGNTGTVVTVTDYVASTNTITFTPAVSGIVASNRFIVGLIIPKGAALRYYDGHLFVGCTPDNQAELRFSEISDPNTGAVMTIDNPRAWPSANELALNVIDQEKLWGITPVLRDRIIAHKASGLWRLERDPLTVYRLELVSRAVGSRFPDTWAEKNNLLYFLGQDKDGLPEVYKTDMVDVTLVDPDGGVEPTLRGLQQPNAVQQIRLFTSQSDFDSGTPSTGTLTESGQLGISPDLPAIVSNSNIDTALGGGVAGYHGLLGNVVWAVRYDAADGLIPDSAAIPWVQTPGHASWNIVAGNLEGPSTVGSFYRNDVFDSGENAIMATRNYLSSASEGNSFSIRIANGAYSAWISVVFSGGSTKYTGVDLEGAGLQAASWNAADTWHIYTLQLVGSTYRFYVDGVLVRAGTALTTTENQVLFTNGYVSTFGANPSFGSGGGHGYISKVFYSDTSTSGVPATIPVGGNFVVQYDFTRTPDALGRFYQTATLYGATIALASWTSSSSDFSTGNDAAGYVSFTNGNQPTSAIKRYMRISVTITTTDILSAPDITAVYAGMLWTSPAIQVGSNISAWRSFLNTIVTPAGTSQVIKIRRATITTEPAEGDWGAFFTIVNGDNIGTILSDVVPTSRWVQLKVEQAPSSVGLLPYIDAMVVQWTEGSVGNLPVRAVVHKKRYMIVAATAAAAANDLIIVCDRNDQWTKFAGLSLNALIHFAGQLYGLDAAAATQRIMDIEGLYGDDGVAISAFLVTREEDLGAAHLRKNFRSSYLHVDRVSAAWALTTSYRRTGDSGFTGSGSFNMGTTGLDVKQNFPVATTGKRIQRKYANAVLDENMAFGGETFFFDIRPPQP